MFYVDNDRCTGCGECISVCKTGALVMMGDNAWIDKELCNQCEACLSFCKAGAIIFLEVVESPTAMAVQIPYSSSITGQTDSRLSLGQAVRGLIKPALSATLFWAGNEVFPHLLSFAKEWLVQQKPATSSLHSSSVNQSRIERTPSGGSKKRQRQRTRRGR
ncbi:MAG: 4Fe-4S binding protein [Anaerolineales bacterium]|nr:4Fe-4S binding protein [Anaerolineales bacterium]